MDSAPSKISSNISGFLRFSKLCKVGSTKVLSGEKNPSAAQDSSSGEASDFGDQRIHPQPLTETLISSSEDSKRVVLSSLFDAISALKFAYIQLQQAHIPYEPKLIQAADALVVSELESLAELERLSNISSEIQQHHELLEELQLKSQAQEYEILRLKLEIEELNSTNVELGEEIKQKDVHGNEFFLLNREWTPSVFYDLFRLAYKSIHEFAKPLISLMKASGWDLDRAADSVADSVYYAERSHKKFAFESRLSMIMLAVGVDDCFNLDHFDHVMSFRDPFDALLDDPDSDFARFCRSKYLTIVHSKMEGSFFGNLDQREFVLRGGHPRTLFYRAFVRMARWIWALHVMTHSFIPKAEIFYVKKGESYSEDFMENVVNLPLVEGDEMLAVGLTVTPGFKIGRDVIRCRVYLCKMKPSI